MAIDIAEFLTGLGLERYIAEFAREEIDAETLWHLEDADLREIGLPLGPRKKLLRAIENLTAERQFEGGAPVYRAVAAP
jgi:hypothetical protein